MMAIFMLSLGGLPLTGGFIGKYFCSADFFSAGKRKSRLVLLARGLGDYQYGRVFLLLRVLSARCI
jgi:NADH:ubiquinone oxidoreductase subunit 2 (subunit N)